jgi:parallel beta-helix repeat protein
LPKLGYNNYTLVFEIENATLNIKAISYSLSQIVNVTAENVTVVNETLIQYKAVVNRPVKWNKKVKFSNMVSPVSIEIPEEAFNVSVSKIEEETETGIDKAFIMVDNERAKLTLYNLLQKERRAKKKDNSTIIIEEPVEEVSIEYYTEAPSASEEIIDDYHKKIIIASDIHYVDILAQTTLPVEAPVQSIHLYWIVNDTRTEVNYSEYDANNNSLIDYIEWNVPHLSNQTYEIEINIINVHSHPSLYGNWTVMFNTTGIANLTITATRDVNYSEEYTRWSDDSENESLYDLRFLELRCGNATLDYSWDGTNCSGNECSVVIADYSCNETGYEISKVLTQERHVLKFNYGGYEVYAYNDVNISGCTNIASAGTYYLNESIIDSAISNCILITANDVVLNCLNNTIDGNDVAQHGIYIPRFSSTDVNITIKNCTITDWDNVAVYVRNANEVTIENVNISSNPSRGIFLDSSNNNTISDSYITNNNVGMYIFSSSDNLIYNNFFNNTDNFNYVISAGTMILMEMQFVMKLT